MVAHPPRCYRLLGGKRKSLRWTLMSYVMLDYGLSLRRAVQRTGLINLPTFAKLDKWINLSKALAIKPTVLLHSECFQQV